MQAGWILDGLLEGKAVYSYSIKLYTTFEARKCKVHKRKCISGCCGFYWDGAEYSVFGLSIITAAGHEIGKIRISWYLCWLEFQKYQN